MGLAHVVTDVGNWERITAAAQALVASVAVATQRHSLVRISGLVQAKVLALLPAVVQSAPVVAVQRLTAAVTPRGLTAAVGGTSTATLLLTGSSAPSPPQMAGADAVPEAMGTSPRLGALSLGGPAHRGAAVVAKVQEAWGAVAKRTVSIAQHQLEGIRTGVAGAVARMLPPRPPAPRPAALTVSRGGSPEVAAAACGAPSTSGRLSVQFVQRKGPRATGMARSQSAGLLPAPGLAAIARRSDSVDLLP